MFYFYYVVSHRFFLAFSVLISCIGVQALLLELEGDVRAEADGAAPAPLPPLRQGGLRLLQLQAFHPSPKVSPLLSCFL